MAPKFKQLQPKAPPINKPTSELVIDQAQSLELVRTVMTATISTIAWCREIFNDDLFVIRVYDCADPSTSYHSFIQGSSDFSFERSDNTLNWRVLSRGLDPAADKLLDWLELGVTDALTRKYLSKLQLSFHTLDGAEVNDENLIEAHILTIKYDNGTPTFATETKAGKIYATNSIVLNSAKKELQGVIKNVALLTQDLGPLPAQRRMNMKLMYNETCPPNYEPRGFRTCSDQGPSILTSDRGARAGSMSTGFHSVSVKVIQQSTEKASKNQIESLREVCATGREGSNDETNEGTTNEICGTPATMTARVLSNLRQQNWQASSPDICGSSTQEDVVKLFQSMGTSRIPNSDTQDTLPISLVSKLNNIPTQQSITTASPLECYLPYSQSVLTRIVMRQEQTAEHLINQQSLEKKFQCECNSTDSEHRLLNPGSKPVAATLQCILLAEKPLLREIGDLCIKRRALYYLIEHRGLRAIEPLAAFLGRDEKTTLRILDDLKSEGLVKAAISTGKGRTKIPKTILELSRGDATLQAKFFNPRMKIEHHLTIPENFFAAVVSKDSMHVEPRQGFLSSIGNNFNGQDICSNQTQPVESSDGTPMQIGSSTEGTPTPEPHLHSPSVVRNQTPTIGRPSKSGAPSAPTLTLPNDCISERSGNVGVSSKRAIELGYRGISGACVSILSNGLDTQHESADEFGHGEQRRKRIKTSSVRSPWVLRKDTQ